MNMNAKTLSSVVQEILMQKIQDELDSIKAKHLKAFHDDVSTVFAKAATGSYFTITEAFDEAGLEMKLVLKINKDVK